MGRTDSSSAACYQIRFEPLQTAARALTFRCDVHGHVELDALGETARIEYLFARALVGRDFARPSIVRIDAGAGLQPA
jgi:hypothetical protein